MALNFHIRVTGLLQQAPANGDGIAFISPQNKTVEIRGWASQQLLNSIVTEQEPVKKIKPNFQTAQGVSGVLVVEVESRSRFYDTDTNSGSSEILLAGTKQKPRISRLLSFVLLHCPAVSNFKVLS